MGIPAESVTYIAPRHGGAAAKQQLLRQLYGDINGTSSSAIASDTGAPKLVLILYDSVNAANQAGGAFTVVAVRSAAAAAFALQNTVPTTVSQRDFDELCLLAKASLQIEDRGVLVQDGFRWATIVPPTSTGCRLDAATLPAAIAAELRRHALQTSDLSAVLVTGVSVSAYLLASIVEIISVAQLSQAGSDVHRRRVI